jgi:hypothetical protein
MTMFRFGPLLAVGGAACLVAWTPEGRPPPPEVGALHPEAGRPLGLQVDASTPPNATARQTGTGQAARSWIPARLTYYEIRPANAASTARDALAAVHPPLLDSPKSDAHDANLAPQFAYADIPGPARGSVVGLKPPAVLGAEPARVPAASPGPAQGDTDAKVQLAYADPEGAAPTLGASSEIAPPSSTAALEPSAPAATPEPSAPAAGPVLLPPPPTSQAAILYKKGDVAGLAALAASASDASERLALEWASLRADAHPSFASLAAFLKAHPGWPGRGWIRERQEAELAAHRPAPAQVAAFFAGEPPQSSAGKIAAARAAQAMGRP